MNIKLHLAIPCLLLSAMTVCGQEDVQLIDSARIVLDKTHKCDDAMRILNRISIANRQSPEYYLYMGRTQDCMKNNEQALYYYNKYLAIRPENDSIKKRTAELTDEKTRTQHGGNEERKAKDIYQVASKNRKKRRRNLEDNYSSTGIGYGKGLGGTKSPFKDIISFQFSSDIPIIKNKAVLDINSTTNILLSPNVSWFVNAMNTPLGYVPSANIGTGFSESITIGFCPILINKKDIALAAGVLGGGHYYSFPSSSFLDVYSASVSDKLMFCYGIKSNLYLGQHVMLYVNLLLNSANTATVSSSYVSHRETVSYGMINTGIAVKFDTWW
jgi:tetratricopeptide (TPR) repeat protein